MNFSFRSRDQIPNYIVLTIFTAFSILPIILLFLNSIKPQEEFGVNPLGFPSTIRWENYLDAWILGEYYNIFLNTLKLVIGTLILCLFSTFLHVLFGPILLDLQLLELRKIPQRQLKQL